MGSSCSVGVGPPPGDPDEPMSTSEFDAAELVTAKEALRRVAPLRRPGPGDAKGNQVAPADERRAPSPAEEPKPLLSKGTTPKPLSVRTISTALSTRGDEAAKRDPLGLQRSFAQAKGSSPGSKTPRAMQRMSAVQGTQRAPMSLLRRFVPSLVVQFYIDHTTATPGWDPQLPMWSSLPGAVLLADMSGFTPLSERLSAKGVGGVEELSRHLNAYFSQMIETILRRGGDIVKFAGDALLVLWADVRPSRERNLSLPDLTVLASDCALSLHANLHGYQPVPGVTLSLHSGIGAGDVYAAHVGGFQSRREFVIHGKPLRQLRQAVDLARNGELVLSAEASSLLPKAAQKTLQPTYTGGCFVMTSLGDDVDVPALPRRNSISTAGDHFAATQYLRTYVPAFLLPRLDATSHARLAELRTITTLFINLPDVDPETMGEAAAFAQFQSIVVIVQEAANRYRGTIRQLITDDKGTVMIVVFGLVQQDDSAYNGVRSAIRMYRKCRNRTDESKVDHDLSIGVATGGAFCGLVGNRHRREYAVVGDRVNLAARLMSKAHKQILVDQNTYEAAEATVARRASELKGLLTFTPLPGMRVKGKAAAIQTYIPEYVSSSNVATARAEQLPAQQQSKAQQPEASGLVGRVGTMAHVRQYLRAAADWHREHMSGLTSPDLLPTPGGTPLTSPLPSPATASALRLRLATPPLTTGAERDREREPGANYMPLAISRTPTKGVGALFVIGHEGMGKSAVLQATASAAEDVGFKTLTCRTDARRRNVPYAAIRGVIAQLLMCFELDASAHRAMATRIGNPGEALRSAVAAAAQHLPAHVQEHLPLLNMVLDNLQLPPNDASRALVGVARGHALENVVLHLFYAYTRTVCSSGNMASAAAAAFTKGPAAGAAGRTRASRRRSIYGGCVQPTAGVLVLCDDAHLLDRHSLHLLIRLIREPHCVVVISSRPVLTADAGAPPPPMGGTLSPGAARTFWEVLSTDARTHILELEALTPLDASLLAADELSQLPDVAAAARDLRIHADVVDVIWQHTGGNPGFVKAFVGHLRQEGLLLLGPSAPSPDKPGAAAAKNEGEGEEEEKMTDDDAGKTHVSFSHPERMGKIKLPTSVQASIGSRVDTLPANVHVLLKLCSVIGRTVESQMLNDIVNLLGTRSTASGSSLMASFHSHSGGGDDSLSVTSADESLCDDDDGGSKPSSGGRSVDVATLSVDDRMEMLCDMGFMEFAGFDQAGASRVMSQSDVGAPQNDSLTMCYDFKLPAVRDVVYERLTYKDRADFHRHVAEWYEHRREMQALTTSPSTGAIVLPRLSDQGLEVDLLADGESTDAPELQDSVIAYHWRKCAKYETSPEAAEGAKVKAVTFLLRAGHATATKQFSNDQALRLFKEALNLVRELHDRNSPENMRIELEILTKFGPFRIEGVPGYEDAQDRYRRMLQLSEDLPGHPYRFPGLVGRFQARLSDCARLLPISAALQTADEVESLGPSSGSEEVELGHVQTVVHLLRAEFVMASSSAVQTADAYDPAEHHGNTFLYAGHDPGVCCLALRAVSCVCHGDIDAGRRAMQASVALAEQLEDPASLVHAHSVCALVALVLRDTGLLQRHCEAAVAAAAADDEEPPAPVRVMQAVVDVQQAHDAGRERSAYTIEQPFRDAKLTAASGELAMLWLLLLPLAPIEVYATVGRVDDAMRVVEQWLSDSRQTQLPVPAECHRLLGVLRAHQARDLARDGDMFDAHRFETLCCGAVRAFAAAIAAAQASEARLFELRALTSLFDLLMADDCAAARAGMRRELAAAVADIAPGEDADEYYVGRLQTLFRALDTQDGDLAAGSGSAGSSVASSRRASIVPTCADLIEARRTLERAVRRSPGHSRPGSGLSSGSSSGLYR